MHLVDLEAQKLALGVELQAAERKVELPDVSVIAAKWRAVAEALGKLPKLTTSPELEAAGKSLQSLLGMVRVDRDGKGYADLSIGVPVDLVAGARFVLSRAFRAESGSNKRETGVLPRVGRDALTQKLCNARQSHPVRFHNVAPPRCAEGISTRITDCRLIKP